MSTPPSLRRPVHLLRSATLLVRMGQFGELGQKLRERLFDNTSLVGLRLDSEPQLGDRARRKDLLVRRARPSDLAGILDVGEGSLARRERRDRIMRLRMAEAEIQTCFVAEDQTGSPCFIQWLVLPDQNERLLEVFGGWYPPLDEGEAMIEFAYTIPSRRGEGIMVEATSRILSIAREHGVKRVVTFIPTVNSLSLAIHLRMGFVPYLLHLERRWMGVLHRRFIPVDSLEGRVPGFDSSQFLALGRKPKG